MKATFFKGIVLGAVTATVAMTAATALAGNGIGDVFNLGVVNGVDQISVLKGATANDQLRVNNQSPTDAAVGVRGLHSAGAGTGAGVLGETSSSSGGATGVFGRVASPNAGDGSTAVKGINNGNGFGEYGQTNGAGDYAAGVYGVHANVAGGGAGVRGDTSSQAANASGVFGQVSSPDAAVGSAAVRGINNGKGIGVYGRNPNDVPFGYAVFGEGRYGVVGSALFAGASSGVYGSAPKGFAGVEGHTGNKDGVGVYGQNGAGGTAVFGTSSGGYGVHGTGSYGLVGGGTQGGVWATTDNASGAGVYGQNTSNGNGVYGSGGASGTGVVGKVSGGGVGVHGEAGPNGVGVKGVGNNGQYATSYAGQFIGEVDVQGYLRLPISYSAPPESDCLYVNHRGRVQIVFDQNDNHKWIFICTKSGWRSVYD